MHLVLKLDIHVSWHYKLVLEMGVSDNCQAHKMLFIENL